MARQQCGAGSIIRQLPEDEREDFVEGLHNEGMTWKQIAQAMSGAGYGAVSYRSLRAHMNEDCSCRVINDTVTGNPFTMRGDSK